MKGRYKKLKIILVRNLRFALQDLISGQWMYKHADLRPWDPRNDMCQYEYNYVIQTKTRHQTPMIRTASIVSVDPQTVVSSSLLVFVLTSIPPC
jgi:hypothetical protein